MTRTCPACAERRLHTDDERRDHHPYAGHGYTGTVWTHPDLNPLLDVTNQAGAANLAAGISGEATVEGSAPAAEGKANYDQ